MNKILIVGRLVRDPEVQSTGSGIKYARFTVAVDRPFGENQADFIPCVAWRQSAEYMETYIKKGSLVTIEGAFNSSSFEDKDGNKKVKYEINVERISSLSTGAKSSDAQSQPKQESQTNSSAPVQETKTTTVDTKTAGVPWDLDL